MMDHETHEHHFLFPKELYERNIVVPINRDWHARFHSYHTHNCTSGKNRVCNKPNGWCQYSNVCCYFKTHTPYGQRITKRLFYYVM
jgi:hypothetical protein